jgi:hypothetical protein
MFRRTFLASAAAFASLPAIPRFAMAAEAPDRQALHVLDRLAFGPNEADFRHVKATGIDGYITEQLNPERIPEAPALDERLASLATLRLDPIQLFIDYGPILPVNGVKASPDEQKARRRRANIIVMEARAARIWRALYSPRQLHEVMVDFWFNHFNVFAGKGLDHLWVGTFEETAIRPHALGHFADLVRATAHHPAMLFYLDNFQNTVAGFKTPDGRELGINENYARELMELHTLGVDGGYTQDDVIALARILTGWSLPRPRVMPPDRTGFFFYPQRHDNGTKRFLGRDIAGNGEREGEEALDILAHSPATARHISTKLVQYFVADTPPPGLVERLATRFQETGGDIRAVLQVLFSSREFRDGIGSKYKSPYRYVLSAARAAGVDVNNPRPLLGAIARLGQQVYGCQTPDGFRDSEDAWLSPDATLLRVSFATALGAGRLPLQAAPVLEGPVIEASAPATPPPSPPQGGAPIDAAPLGGLLQPMLTERTRSVVAAAAPAMQAGLILGSPDFMRR